MSNLRTSLLISTCVVLMSAVTPAFADASNTYINGSLGLQDFDHDRFLKSDKSITLGLEHRYNNGWGAEVFWIDSSPAGRSGASDVDLTQYGIDGLYYFNSAESNAHDSIQPYGAFGLGHADFKSSARSNKETQLRAGLGLRMILNDHWSAKADVRLIYSKEEQALDNTLTVGLSYALNHQTKTVPPADGDNDGVIDLNDSCPTTPLSVQVDSTGCAFDTDGDGVPNHADNCPTTPAGTKVNSVGCAIDSDNDGVVNEKDNCPTTAAGVTVDMHGCKLIVTYMAEMALKINFTNNSDVVTEKYFAEIEKVANFMTTHSGVNTIIEGHTDNNGTNLFNADLSKRRAEAVMAILVERFDIGADRMSAMGYGETQPIAKNDTESGRHANRRVVAVMKAKMTR